MSLLVLNGANDTTYDLTRFIPVPKYKVNAIEEYKEWIDSNQKTHKRLLSSKAQGSFTLKFPTIEDYAEFMTFYQANMDEDEGTINADVFLMKPYGMRTGIDVFIEFDPENDLPLIASSGGNGFNVDIMQQESGL